jgi:hypothetical protein
MSHNGTLLDVWSAFEKVESKDISLYQSALFRFTLPGLGGRRPSGARLSSKEIAAALKVLASISIFCDIPDRLREAQKRTFELLNTPKKRQRQPRYYLNKLIDWSIKNNFFPSVSLPEVKSQYVFYPNKVKRKKTTNRGKPSKIVFSFDASDYIDESLQPEQIQSHLQRISQEFAAFKKYEITTRGVREVTFRRNEQALKQLLGWLYRTGKAPLANISLNSLVPLVRLDFKISDFPADKNPWLAQIIAKAEALENIKDEAKKLVNLLTDYFEWLENPPSLATKRMYVEALLGYSKYVYRMETDKTMALNFEDIPLINRLKVFHNELKTAKRSKSNPNCTYLPWTDILEVLEKLRFEADLETNESENRRFKRRLSAKSKSLQDFILIGFFVLVPPSRQRVVRELELGKTLKYGIFENGRFTPIEKMANPSEARYYIHLLPEDYKTGNTYGEWLGEFPNTEFLDGSRFYDYLNRWLFRGFQDESGEWHGLRKAVADPSAKTVFIRGTTGISYSMGNISQKIKNIFTRWTGVPITPHELRHLYRTYIDDPETGASQAEKESAAYWMRHSSDTAKKEYSHLSNEQKLRAGAQLAERLNQQLLKGKGLG